MFSSGYGLFSFGLNRGRLLHQGPDIVVPNKVTVLLQTRVYLRLVLEKCEF